MAITSLTLILSSGVHLYNQISTYRQTLHKIIITFSGIVSLEAVENIKSEKGPVEESSLNALVAAEIIENVHIYRANDQSSLEIFSSYNKPGIAPVKAQFDRISELGEPTITGSVIELVTPIIDGKDIVGYVYLRASADVLDGLIQQSILSTIVVVLLCLLISYLLTLKLQNSITAPINTLVKVVQRIARQKTYSSRASRTGIKEIDILGTAFNSLLQHTQDQIQKQAEIEAEQSKLNVSLEGKVQQRTLALKKANNELIQTLEKLHQFQRQMVQNEKMASLGDMVAGVAHEVNTPIGLGVTSSTMMLDRLADMRKAFETDTLKASSLTKFIAEGEENLNIIYRNLNRAAELIANFKQVAVDQTSDNSRIFAFDELLDEILLSMRPKLKKVTHQINVNCPSNLIIESKTGPINQIISNLIMNSIIHGLDDIASGPIDIEVTLVEETSISLVYKDNGRGIPQSFQQKIFDPFVTTKRGHGGSGLGMHLVFNLVTQALNGSISLISEEGQGVQFNIVFPVKNKNASMINSDQLLV